MEKHIAHDNIVKELDIMISRINGLEASSTDEYQRSMSSVLKTLAQGELNMFQELEHMKKALDLLTLELFKIKNKTGA
ncbi:MAG: hypothetical protein VB736_04950 [Candidatus Nitrosopelagicus sp.]|jgi:hypothetical protein|nr:hypothetical protein [Thermoproteota archaeon]|tara:strand:+ start:305 stop:538 length:234 start_codon:yes stop_codon:yes gene_type:complete